MAHSLRSPVPHAHLCPTQGQPIVCLCRLTHKVHPGCLLSWSFQVCWSQALPGQTQIWARLEACRRPTGGQTRGLWKKVQMKSTWLYLKGPNTSHLIL